MLLSVYTNSQKTEENQMIKGIVILFLSTPFLFSVNAFAADSNKSDAQAQQVMNLEIDSISFGMQPITIIEKLTANGYKVTKETRPDSNGIQHWQLQKATKSRDRYKVELSATTEAARKLNYSFISGRRDGFDMNAEHARLVAHFEDDPCENARRMIRCYFPNGDRGNKVLVKATIDSRMYSLEFTDRR